MTTEKEPLITKEMENELLTMGSGLTHEEEEKEMNRKAKEQKEQEAK